MDREKTNADALWGRGRLDISQLIPRRRPRSRIEKARRSSRHQKRSWFCFAKYRGRSRPLSPPPADSIRLAQDRHFGVRIVPLRKPLKKFRSYGCPKIFEGK